MSLYNECTKRIGRFNSTIPMTVGTLIYRMDEGMIDLDPPYQREVVWTQNQMRSFVETLWMDYPVPMIFMARQAAHGEARQ